MGGFKSDKGSRRLRSRLQGGFTIVSTAMGVIVGTVVLTGAWMGFNDMKVQWHVANADRQMDQYAASVMQDITNTASWAWGAKIINPGPRNLRVKFLMQDLISEYGPLQLMVDKRPDDQEGFRTLTYDSRAGIMWGGRPPRWARDQANHNQYVFTGTTPGMYRTKAFDRRDQTSIEGMVVEFNRMDRYYMGSDPREPLKRQGLVEVSLTMHYTYTATNAGRHILGRLFSDRYVHERIYTTQVFMRNWDVEQNAYKDGLLGIPSGS
jgi:hypothetical protein